MTIYVDAEFKCHLSDDGTMTEIETEFFNGKCDEFVEGYCYKVAGGSTTIYPWKPYSELDAAQRRYERELAEAARILLGEVSA